MTSSSIRPTNSCSATTSEAKEFLTEAGFVRAIVGTRFLPGSDGEHTPGDPHVVMGVLQFESEEGARDAVDWYHDDGRQPCPGKCAAVISEFEVDGISDAKGVRRVVTAEALRQTGEEREPSDAYDIRFADGVFAYFVGTFGGPRARDDGSDRRGDREARLRPGQGRAPARGVAGRGSGIPSITGLVGVVADA